MQRQSGVAIPLFLSFVSSYSKVVSSKCVCVCVDVFAFAMREYVRLIRV